MIPHAFRQRRSHAALRNPRQGRTRGPVARVAAASAVYPPLAAAAAAGIAAPVLVVSGERDPVLGRGPRLAQALAQGRYLEVPGADHFALAADRGAQVAVAAFLACGDVGCATGRPMVSSGG